MPLEMSFMLSATYQRTSGCSMRRTMFRCYAKCSICFNAICQTLICNGVSCNNVYNVTKWFKRRLKINVTLGTTLSATLTPVSTVALTLLSRASLVSHCKSHRESVNRIVIHTLTLTAIRLMSSLEHVNVVPRRFSGTIIVATHREPVEYATHCSAR